MRQQAVVNFNQTIEQERAMKNLWKCISGLCVIVTSVGFTVANAQTVANGPYYATPSWDQTLPVATRFIVLSNFNSEAVLDRETGLVWERTPAVTPITRNSAVAHCFHRKTGGRMGWRLPQASELLSLIDPALIPDFVLPAPAALPSGHPFVNVAATFWSTSVLGAPFGPTDGGFLGVNTQFGIIQSSLPAAGGSVWRTWCVRSGSGESMAF